MFRIGRVEEIAAQRMTAADQFYKTMLYLATPRADMIKDLRRELAGNLPAAARKSVNARIARFENRQRREHATVVAICFEEEPAIDAAKRLGVSRDNAAAFVRHSFDCLAEALAIMRKCRKELAESAET